MPLFYLNGRKDSGFVMQYCMAFDLGTSGVKASLHDAMGKMLINTQRSYPTSYDQEGYHEQRPLDWWEKVCSASSELIERSSEIGILARSIVAVAVSGHSLVAVPLDRTGEVLLDSVPIWSDRRAKEQVIRVFARTDYQTWYEQTGNGDPAECYTLFKLMWMKDHLRELYDQTSFALGSKDFINYMLTGEIATDYSYASGSGLFNLLSNSYMAEYADLADIRLSLFPQPTEAHTVIGRVSPFAAEATGLRSGTAVVCGGVDNACMALGACGLGEGRTYISLGTSCWLASTNQKPLVDFQSKPFIFAHLEKGWYTSGASLLSGCSAFDWLHSLTSNSSRSESGELKIDELISDVQIGSNGVIFNPHLAGGGNHFFPENMRGAIVGLTLATRKEELYRAVYEGIAMELFKFWNQFSTKDEADFPIILTGGGSKSDVWCQLIADLFSREMMRGFLSQYTASFGAAAVALRGIGLWKDYSEIDHFLGQGVRIKPDGPSVEEYKSIKTQYDTWSSMLFDYYK